MDRKQATILGTLVALILLLGWATHELKGKNFDFLNKPVGSLRHEDREDEVEDTFIQKQVDRENMMTASMKLLRDVIEDETSGKEQKEKATAQLDRLLQLQQMETNLESELQAQGFESVLCLVAEDFNNVTVYLKLDQELSEEQFKKIRAIVVSQTNIKEVEIARKS